MTGEAGTSGRHPGVPSWRRTIGLQIGDGGYGLGKTGLERSTSVQKLQVLRPARDRQKISTRKRTRNRTRGGRRRPQRQSISDVRWPSGATGRRLPQRPFETQPWRAREACHPRPRSPSDKSRRTPTDALPGTAFSRSGRVPCPLRPDRYAADSSTSHRH